MAQGSAKAVYAAIAANGFVMVAKFVAFALSGSPALLSEGIHSLADVGNQSLLAFGMRSSAAPATAQFPYGYQRDRFVWALVSAVGIFFLGCGVTVYHGVDSLLHPHPPTASLWLTAGVLVLSAVIEGASLLVAVREVRVQAAGRPLRQFLAETDDPLAASVLLEDVAAITGVLLALVGVLVTHLTGSPAFDALASIAIGLLLGGVAIILVRRNRELLLGTTPSPELVDRAMDVLRSDPTVERLLRVKAVVLGSDEVHFKAEVEFDGHEIARRCLADADLEARWAELAGPDDLRRALVEFGDQVIEALGDEVDRLEQRLGEAVPDMTHVDLEAD